MIMVTKVTSHIIAGIPAGIAASSGRITSIPTSVGIATSITSTIRIEKTHIYISFRYHYMLDNYICDSRCRRNLDIRDE